MLELVELRFRMIGRFVAEQTVRFSLLGAFVQVDGENRNNKGSSGSGKTTVFNALDYLLSLNNIAATILQSRKIINPDEDPIWVEGDFLFNGLPLTMTRSKSKFEINSNGDIKKGAAAEAELARILGMPTDLFRKVIHKRQKEGGFFLNLKPSEMHDFLMDCCGLSQFKAKYLTIEAEIKKLDLKRASIENELNTAQTSLSATQDAILALGLAPIQDIHKEVVNELKEKYDRSAIRFADVQNQCEAVEREHAKNRPITSQHAFDDSLRESLEKRRDEIESDIRACYDAENRRQEDIRLKLSENARLHTKIKYRVSQGEVAKEMAAKLASEIKSIRSCKCPTCAQDWATESAAAVERQKLQELTQLKTIIVDASVAVNEKVTLDQETEILKSTLAPITSPKLPVLNAELSDVTAKIIEEKRKVSELYDQQSTEMKAKLDAFVASSSALSAKHKVEIEQVRGQMDIDRRIYESAVQKLRSYEEAKERFDRTYTELAKKAENFEKVTLKCRSELEGTLEYLKFALESEKCIKMYVSYSFDEALDAISDKATKIIRCIPNTSNATIQFEGTKETQKGTVKEEVNAVISVDGEIGVPIKSLSGGERTSTDHAVDLSVIDYIETKTGKGMNLFILDEPFDGLGTVEVEMVLEVFKNANINKKLIIVDHNPEVKEMVLDRLVVVRDGLTSNIA